MTLLIIYCTTAIIICFICSILEATFLSITPSYVTSYEKKNPKIGGYLRYLKENVDDAEGAILVLNTFGVTATSTGVGIQIAHIFGVEWQSFGAALLTIVLIYACEIFPKTLGATYWKNFAPMVTITVHYLLKVTYPFVVVAKFITHFVKPDKEGNSVSRDEILAASKIGEEGGSITKKEQSIIENLFTLKNKQTIDILTPRNVVFALKQDLSIEEALNFERIYSYSYVPLYDEIIDNIIGVIYAPDILEEGIRTNTNKQICEFIQPIYAVQLNLPVINLLKLFISKNEKIFIVQDNYGQLVGIVTLEDAIETLLGVEIIDEFDEASDMQKLAKEKLHSMKLKYMKKMHHKKKNSDKLGN